MSYSVVIRTKNSDKTIKGCLESLLSQTLPPREIIVVDSGSKDKTIEILENYPIKLINYPIDIEFNYSKALNVGIGETSSEFILILSSHVELVNLHTASWMLKILKNDKDYVAVSILRSDHKITEINDFDNIDFTEINLKNFDGRAIYNFCSFIYKSSWNKYNFNENMPSCEDQDWALFFLKQQFKTVVLNRPRVYYCNPYYNLYKDFRDTIVIGEYIYPKFLSNKYVNSLFIESLLNIKNKQLKKGWNNVLIAMCILRHKYVKKYKFVSTYSKKLE